MLFSFQLVELLEYIYKPRAIFPFHYAVIFITVTEEKIDIMFLKFKTIDMKIELIELGGVIWWPYRS